MIVVFGHRIPILWVNRIPVMRSYASSRRSRLHGFSGATDVGIGVIGCELDGPHLLYDRLRIDFQFALRRIAIDS